MSAASRCNLGPSLLGAWRQATATVLRPPNEGQHPPPPLRLTIVAHLRLLSQVDRPCGVAAVAAAGPPAAPWHVADQPAKPASSSCSSTPIDHLALIHSPDCPVLTPVPFRSSVPAFPLSRHLLTRPRPQSDLDHLTHIDQICVRSQSHSKWTSALQCPSAGESRLYGHGHRVDIRC